MHAVAVAAAVCLIFPLLLLLLFRVSLLLLVVSSSVRRALYLPLPFTLSLLLLCHFPIFCVQFLCVTVIFGMGALNLFGKRVLNRGRKLVNGRLCLSQSVLNIVIYLT